MTLPDQGGSVERYVEWPLYGVCKGCGAAYSSMHMLGCPRPGREDIRVVRAPSDEKGRSNAR